MTTLALPAGPRPRSRTAETSTRCVAALALAIAGAAHGLAVIDHRHSIAAAAFFAAVGLLQLGLAVAYVRRPGHVLRLLIAASTTLLLGVWAASRTIGIAVGHSHGPEGIGMLDATAVAAEVVTLFAIARSSRLGRRRRQLSLSVALSIALAGMAVYGAWRPATGHAPHGPTTTTREDDAATTDGADARAAAHEHNGCHNPGCEPHPHP